MKESTSELILQLWRHLRIKRKKQIVFSFLLMLTSAFLEIISIASVSPFIVFITDQENFEKFETLKNILYKLNLTNNNQILILLSTVFIFLIILSAFIRILNIKFSLNIAAKISNDLGSESYFRSLHQSYETHLLRNSSKIISNNMLDLNRTQSIIFNTLTFCTSALISLAIVFTLLKVDILITVCSATILGIGYFLVGNWSRKVLRRNSALISESNNLQIKSMQEGLGAFREVILEGLQIKYSEKYKKYDWISRKKWAQNALINSIPRFSFEALAISIMIIFALIYSISAFNNNFIPTLALFALASQKLLPAMQQCYSSLSNIRAQLTSLKYILENVNQKTEKRFNNQIIKPYKFKNQLTFNNVDFSYEESKNILKKVNLKISKGEKIGISGKTGAGKSTLIDLILGLLKPTKGNIFIDNYDLHDVKNEKIFYKWQKNLSHVPQYIFLNDSSIRENIAFGINKDQVDNKLLKETIKAANLSDFISSLPNGVDTIVGERGFLLSGGQRQRIGIARALYKKSKIIILDEATNALDEITENKIFSMLCKESSDLTVIIIAHNKNVFKFCDRIIKVEKGEIVF